MKSNPNHPSNKHILVLGGTGFIGSHIVDSLIAQNFRVRVVSQSPERYRPPVSGVEYRLFDYTDQKQLDDALKDVDIVVHTLSSTTPANSNQNPEMDVRDNLIGTIRLLECMRESGVRRIVYLSSGGTVYGIPEYLPIKETHPLHPLCSYAACKVAIENYLNVYAHLYGIEPVILRAANPYGARQNPTSGQGVIAAFVYKTLRNQPLTLWGDGSIVRDFFHVTDLAQLCCKVIRKDHMGTFNVGSGCGHSLNEIIEAIAKVTGKSPVVEKQSGRPFDIPSIFLDISRAQSTFDWAPSVRLEDGIDEYYRWLSDRGESIESF